MIRMTRTKRSTNSISAYLAAKRKMPFIRNSPKDISQLSRPKNITLKSKEYWCPYCATVVEFKFDSFVGVYYCPCCGISDRDFYVRGMNKLWGR
jgi:hypothetical protein